MVDGFWILKIERPQFTSGGVVVFIRGKVFGGDNAFAWTGTYEERGRLLKGRVAVHHFDPSVESVFGVAGDYELHFSGNLQEETITGTALLANQPQMSLGIRLTKRASL